MLTLLKTAYQSLATLSTLRPFPQKGFQQIRHWLENLEIRDAASAHFLCRTIPAQCPFETKIVVFNRTIVHIPPLCKLNPFYAEVVSLRFRALCYLAERGENISLYC